MLASQMSLNLSVKNKREQRGEMRSVQYRPEAVAIWASIDMGHELKVSTGHWRVGSWFLHGRIVGKEILHAGRLELEEIQVAS